MGFHHRESFGMIPFDDDNMSHLRSLGIHGHASAYQVSPTGMITKKVHVREVDLSNTKYRTPLMYSKIQGMYIQQDDEIDEVSHQWDVNTEEYERDILQNMPDWVTDFMRAVSWQDDCKITKLGRIEEDKQNKHLERITFRYEPGPKYKEQAIVVTFKGAWVDEREVLPKMVQSKSGEARLIADEFDLDVITPGVEELNYHFFLTDGMEYSIEGLYGIEWAEEGSGVKNEAKADLVPLDREISEEVDMDLVINKAIQSALKEDKLPMAEPYEPEISKKKKTRGKGKYGVKLFTILFYIEDNYFIDQVKSKDWSTVWNDVQDKIGSGDYDPMVDGKDLIWDDTLMPFSAGTRNVFIGGFQIKGERDVVVTVVNTKRGRALGAEEYLENAPYADC